MKKLPILGAAALFLGAIAPGCYSDPSQAVMDPSKLPLHVQQTILKSKECQEKYKTELARVYHAAQPITTFKTISISWNEETSQDGKTWEKESRGKTIWDKEKNRVYNYSSLECNRRGDVKESSDENYYNNGKGVHLWKISYLSKSGVRKEKYRLSASPERSHEKWHEFDFHFLFHHFMSGITDSGRTFPLIGKNSFGFLPLVAMATYKGKPALKVENYIKRDIEGGFYHSTVLFFDPETGVLLEKQRSSDFGDEKITIDEHVSINGSYFPVLITCAQPVIRRMANGLNVKEIMWSRYTVDKATLKLNEVIDESVFIPVISPNAENLDKDKSFWKFWTWNDADITLD